MTDQELVKLHELKGRLKARRTILDSDITFTKRLAEAMVTDHYNGYSKGKVEAYQEWLRSVEYLLVEVEQLIEGGENAEEED